MDQDTSNYKTPISFRDTSNTQVAEIGFHNTGDTDGALILIPRVHSGTNSWAGSVGLYIGKTTFKWENNIILHEGNYRKHIFANKNRSRSTLTVTDSSWNVASGTDIFGLAFKDTGLTYTPEGGSATASSDTGDWRAWLTCAAASNSVALNMRIDGTWQASKFIGPLQGNADTATRINGNLAAATSDVNRNIWVSSTASADGIPNYISGFNMNPSTKVFTVPSGTRISPSSGALYLGNSGNQSWVYVQDMASQSGTDKWKITQAGAATFVGTVTATLFDGPLVHTATGVSYIAGAKGSNATVYAKKATGSVWRPAVVLTTAGGGAWQIGNYNDETLEFQYATKANMDSNTNSTSEIFMQNGDTGRVITSGNKGNWTFTPSSHTHDISQVTWAAGSNLVCTGANTEWSIDMQSSATGSYWHVWSAIKGGSCIQCYNDDRRVNIPVRLDTPWLRVTNDSSNNTDDATVYIQCQTANDWGLKIAKGGKDCGLRVDSLDQSNAIWTNGYIRARCVWANQGSNGERQVGTDSSTSGTIYFYSHTTGKGIYSGSGYQTGAILTINSSGKTFYGALSGNASTATKLATARAINGTNFDGSAAITTSKWGTARTINGSSIDGSGNVTTANWGTSRTLTIGATGKSVNGSGNVSWSKAEILGSSNTGSFYRGDQTWSRTLDGGFICHAIELAGAANPYIDFHANNSSADYTARIINAANDGSVLTLYGSLVYTGTLVHSSSRIIKKDIKSITEEEAKRVFKLRPISYKYQEWFDRFDQPYPSFGFIAEEVLSIMPELVSIPNDYDEAKVRRKEQRPISLKEESLIPYLVKIVQMQQKQIDELKYQVKYLTN